MLTQFSPRPKRRVNKLVHIKTRIINNTMSRAATILSKSDQKKIFIIAAVQVSLSFLDLLGVLTIGLLGALAVTGIQTNATPSQWISVLEFIGISEYAFQTQALLLGILAVSLFVGRTIISIFFTRKILLFFSKRGAVLSEELISKVLNQPIVLIQSRSTQETLYSVTQGVEYITHNILATSLVLIADVSLLLVIGLSLFLVDPATALGSLLLFSLIGFLLYRLMHLRARKLGLAAAKLSIQSSNEIIEVLGSYRESMVRDRRSYYARQIGALRHQLAETAAEINFMPYISKYVIETSMILGGLLVAGSQFYFYDSSRAVTTLGIFLAAGSRITPAVLRIQQGALHIRESSGKAEPTLNLIESLSGVAGVSASRDSMDIEHLGFVSTIQVEGVSYKYPGSSLLALDSIDLTIPEGTKVAIVGTSGSGKSTLVDVMLGILPPTEGGILISGCPPLETISKWPGAIAYVPQSVSTTNKSIKENIGLGFPAEALSADLISMAIKTAYLEDFISASPLGVDAPVGERGSMLSGGQQQRLGIARAVFTNPRLIVLDEATSSLDGETEANINNALNELRSKVTLVVIAHRLSTVRDADLVVYLEAGRVVAKGTFEEIRVKVPNFDRQARLMGL